jgi:CRISPR-associated protein Cas6
MRDVVWTVAQTIRIEVEIRSMPVIDLSFVLVGTTFPLDHGYPLFSAICRVVPAPHGDRRIGAHPIRGRQTARGLLALTDRSRLKLRLMARRMESCSESLPDRVDGNPAGPP